MEIVSRVRLKEEKICFGPGTRELLKQIDKTDSIKKATEEMNLSYVKALRMIRDMEKELGFAFVISHKGGNQRGGTALTDQGKAFLEAFEEVEKEIQKTADKLLQDKLLPIIEQSE